MIEQGPSLYSEKATFEIKDHKDVERWVVEMSRKVEAAVAKLEEFQIRFPQWGVETSQPGPGPDNQLALELVKEGDVLLEEYHQVMSRFRQSSFVDFYSADDPTRIQRERLDLQVVCLLDLRNDIVWQTKIDLQIDFLPEVYQRKTDELVESSIKELEVIKPGLKDMAQRILDLKPDMIVLLDKGARVFGLPLRKYLREQGLVPMPEFRFYNDGRLKLNYVMKDPLEPVVKEELKDLKGKKAFFIDETFSLGQGAAALYSALPHLEAEVYYTALTTDPEPGDFEEGVKYRGYQLSAAAHKATVAKLKAEPHFTMYPAPFAQLFSRLVARWYVDEDEFNLEAAGKTYAKRQKIDYELLDRDLPKTVEGLENAKSDLLPHARAGYKPPYGMTWAEYGLEMQKINLNLVRKVQDLIYKTLNASE